MKSVILFLFSTFTLISYGKEMYNYDDPRFPEICIELHNELYSALKNKVMPNVNKGNGQKAIKELTEVSDTLSGLTICASAMFEKNREPEHMNSEYYADITGQVQLAVIMLDLETKSGKPRSVKCGDGAKFLKKVEKMMDPNSFKK